MSNAMCHTVTDAVTNAVRPALVTPAQNQNQNQTVLTVACGSSVAEEIIHRYCSRDARARRMDGGFAGSIGGQS